MPISHDSAPARSPVAFNADDFLATLGFASGDRVVITHIDDVGWCHGAAAGSFECFDFGLARCGAVLTPSSWLPYVAQTCRTSPHYDLGVHLTLTCEYAAYRWRALSSREPASGLLDEDGCLWRTDALAVEHVSPESAEREFRAQIHAALEAGIDVTHIDGHMGVARAPQYAAVMDRLCREFQVPFITPSLIPQRHHDLHVKRPPTLEGYLERLRAIRPGLNYFMMHAARKSDEMSAAAGQRSAEWRHGAYQAFTSPELKAWFHAEGIQTLGCRELRDYLRARQAFDP